MTTLHLIGDSFFAPMQPKHSDSKRLSHEQYQHFRKIIQLKEWWNILGKKLGVESVLNFSGAGTGLDWMTIQLLDRIKSKQIVSGDLVLISITHPDRKWAVKDAPWASNLSCLKTETFRENLIEDVKANNSNLDEAAMHVQMEAAYNYWLYCKNDVLDNYMSFGLLYFMKEVCRRNNIGIFFINSVANPGEIENRFLNGFNTTGTLQDLAINEFTGKTFMDRQDHRNKAFELDTHWWWGRDQRIAHISFANHEIFAEKLFQAITEGEDLDLNNEMKTQIVDVNDEPELHIFCKENGWDYLENKTI